MLADGASFRKCSYNSPLFQNTLPELKLFRVALNRTIYQKLWKVLCLTKRSASTMNQLKKTTIYELLFIITIYSLENVNKHSSEMKIYHQNSLFTANTIFLGLGPILTAGQKLWLTAMFFEKILLLLKGPTKQLKIIEAQSNCSFRR